MNEIFRCEKNYFNRSFLQIKIISENRPDLCNLRPIYFDWNTDGTDVPTRINTDQKHQRKSV